MRSAVAYLRVSTDEQSLDAQRDACARWARANGAEIRAWHSDEGRSGSLEPEKRPGLLAALGDLARGEVLLVAKRDRLARSVLVAATLERYVSRAGADIACADGVGNGSDPSDVLLRQLVDAFAQYELGMIRLRTGAALAAKKRRGERWTGVAPYGWKWGPAGSPPEPVTEEQDAILRAKALRAAGRSLREIGAVLHAEGHRPRRGPWAPVKVKRLLEFVPTWDA